MKTVEGEVLKNKITKDLHMVTKIAGTRVILENGIGYVCVSIEEKDLELYYQKIEKGDTRCFV